MAKREIFRNDLSSTLSGAIDDGQTSFDVASGAFPATGDYRILVDAEIMLATARSGDTLTCVRGVEGTTAASHSSGAAVTHILSMGSVQRYLRDNDPRHDSARPPFRIVDASGNLLTSSDFTKIDGTEATTPADQDGTISIVKESSSTNPDLTVLHRAQPSTPYSIVANVSLFAPVAGGSSIPAVGIGWRRSANGRLAGVFLRASLVDQARLTYSRYLGPTSLNSSIAVVDCFCGRDVWLRADNDGTNLTVYASPDGVNWVQVYSEAQAEFLISDQIAFFVNNQANTSWPVIGALRAWDEGA